MSDEQAILDQKIREAQEQIATLADGLSKAEYVEFLSEIASWCETMARAAESEGA